MTREFATNVDTELRWFDTLEQAERHADSELLQINGEARDGVDVELATSVCVLKTVSRAVCANPEASYQCQAYQLETVVDLLARQQALIMLRCGWQVKLSPSSTRIQWRSPHGISGSDFESDSLDCPPAAAVRQHKEEFKHCNNL